MKINSRHYKYLSAILFVIITLVGFKDRSLIKDKISWVERKLVWSDFQKVNSIAGDYHATIHSEIYCPSRITKSNSKIVSLMNPNESERVMPNDSINSYQQLLIHEQYHFNITEYHTRLLRRAVVAEGEKKLTKSRLKSLFKNYEKEKNVMQDKYDNISEHNVNYEKQRFWELKIDDLLRQTEYYKNPDLYSYYDFSPQKTNFYKHIYLTFDQKLLKSYPVLESNFANGEVYKIDKSADTLTVKFYKNGKLFNGGEFKTAITKIIYNKDQSSEIHYYDSNMTYNEEKSFCIKRCVNDKDGKRVHYLNKENKRVKNKNVYEVKWDKCLANKMCSSYFNEKGQLTRNNDQVYHEKRSFDNKGRTVKVESYDLELQLMNDKDNGSIYEFVYDNDHKLIQHKTYNTEASLAKHLDSYYLEYEYDERGNLKKSTSLNENGDIDKDKNGVSIYEYSYDLYDNVISIRKYNDEHKPILGNDDYFSRVIDYDELQRKKYDAFYYPNYILKFDDNKWGATKYEYINDSVYFEYNIDGYKENFDNSNGIAIIRKKLNGKKEVIEETNFNTKKKFALNKEGVVSYLNKYDNKGNIIEQVALDSLGRKKYFESDVSTIRWYYDNNNNKVKTVYFNEKGLLANANQNVTYNIYLYDNMNRMVERKNYNKHLKPQYLNGIFKTKFLYNRFGKDSIMLDYDVKSRLINGVCRTEFIYNEYGNSIEDRYYNRNNKLVKNNNGVCIIKYHYDKQNRYNGYSYYNEFSKPILSQEGYHKKQFQLNDLGEIIKVSTYGIEGELVENDQGIARYDYFVNESGMTTEVKYYDKDIKLVNDSQGIARETYTASLNGLYYINQQFDADGNEIKED